MQLVGGMATVPACVGLVGISSAAVHEEVTCTPCLAEDSGHGTACRGWCHLGRPAAPCQEYPRLDTAALQCVHQRRVRIKTDTLHFYIAKVNYESPSFCNTCQSCNGLRGRWYYSVEFLCNISKITAVKTRSWELLHSQASGWVLETLRICCIYLVCRSEV